MMTKLRQFGILTLVLSLLLPLIFANNCSDQDSKVSKSSVKVLKFKDLVKMHGYTAEQYSVDTPDGYILILHRISGSSKKPKTEGKPVVYLQHGIFLSSDSWVLIGPKTDLAFLLVDIGMDVWIGNVRGNTYSGSHRNNNLSPEVYWRFGYHEMAIYDIKTFVDTILSKTGQKSLTYIGFSMGTTLGYAFLSEFPNYNEKINHMYSLSPVVYWKHELKRIPAFVQNYFNTIMFAIETFGLKYLLPQTYAAAWLGYKACENGEVTQAFCINTISNIGLDPNRVNKTSISNILAHFPAGTSTITALNYHQNFVNDRFQAYDYGENGNLIAYNQTKAPIYKLQNVKVPVTIWYAKNDDIVNYKDVLYLCDQLPNLVSCNEVKHKDFNHFDFQWASDVKELLYDNIIDDFKKMHRFHDVTSHKSYYVNDKNNKIDRI